jgi:hypothetical protein
MNNQTIKVIVGSGEEREFPAHYEAVEKFFSDGPYGGMAPPRLVPDEQDGWIFRETVDGKWYGHKTG